MGMGGRRSWAVGLQELLWIQGRRLVAQGLDPELQPGLVSKLRIHGVSSVPPQGVDSELHQGLVSALRIQGRRLIPQGLDPELQQGLA